MDSKSSLNLPSVKSGNKIKIGLPSTKAPAKPQAIIPSLCAYGSDSSTEEEEEITPIKQKSTHLTQEKKALTGLLSLLPPPKSNTFLQKSSSVLKKTLPKDGLNIASSKNVSTGFKDASSLVPRTLKSKAADDDCVTNKKFKSAHKSVKQPYTICPDPVIPNYIESNEDPEPVFAGNDEDEHLTQQQFEPEEFGQASFDLEAMRQLGGGRKNKEFANIQITDVKMNDIIGDNKAELMKNITSNYKPPSNREFFGGGSRKKHQITYLAYVAKEREEELKNTWSQSAFNKKQSRERYGF